VRAARRPLVAGNWKMNPTSRAAAVQLAVDVAAGTSDQPVETVVCPPAVFLEAVAAAARGEGDGPWPAVGAQTMRAEESGAFTGEISPVMLRDLATHVILGHSERRRYDNETDEAVAAKVRSAVDHGLVPITAIGERAEERRAGETEAVIDRQLRAAISLLDRIADSGLVIAYEPVWAIGTGDAATPDDAQAAAAQIRSLLHEADPDGAHEVRILYGGSCTPENAAALFAMPDVDGALVGGASLDAGSFNAIVRAAGELRG
jgi:triosephosphate isomerase (TIM)